MLNQFKKSSNINCRNRNYIRQIGIKSAIRESQCDRTGFMMQTQYQSIVSKQFLSTSCVLNRPHIGVYIELPMNKTPFPKIEDNGIMRQDKPSTKVRLHSGRTDYNKGHHDYKNVSGLGPYHYHNGMPPHTYEDSVKNNISSGLSGLIQSIKAEFDYYIDQVTDPKRRDSLIIGIVASIVQNILKSGLSITEAMVIIADIAANFLSTENSSEIIAFFDDAEVWLSQPIDDLANRVSYKDSYYLGKSLGDIMSMLIGLFGVASGLATFIGSFGLGAGSVAAAPGTAGASLAGIAVSVEGALAGTAIASGSIAIAGTAFSSFGKDFNSFSSVKWKGFSSGELAEHYRKHVVEGNEFGNISQNEYLKQAKNFAAETNSSFMETQVGKFVIKYDPATRRTFIGHLKDREIRTFYIADFRDADPFLAAINKAKELSGIN